MPATPIYTNMYTLYHLICPLSNDIKYVGQTKFPVEIRLKQHIKLSKSKNGRKYHVNYWIENLLEQNRFPIIKEVKTNLTKIDVNSAEKQEIEYLLSKGIKLCNLTNGGDSFSMSETTKIKMSQSKMGIKNSFFGKNHSEQTKKLLSEKAKGKKSSEETKKKLSIKFSGSGNNMFGRPSPLKNHKEETKKIISLKKSKKWVFSNPNNEIITVINLLQFCKENNLNYSCMYKVANGKMQCYKNWRKVIV